MTVKESIEAALKLIPEDREAGTVKVEWYSDGTYTLTIKSDNGNAWDLTQHGLRNVIPCNVTESEA